MYQLKVQEGPAALMRMVPFSRFNPVSPQQQMDQFGRLDAIRTLGNMTEAQRNGFANKHVF